MSREESYFNGPGGFVTDFGVKIRDAYDQIKELTATLIVDKQNKATLCDACKEASTTPLFLQEPLTEPSPDLVSSIERCAESHRGVMDRYERVVASLKKHELKEGPFERIGFERFNEQDIKDTGKKILAIANKAANKAAAQEITWEDAYDMVFKELLLQGHTPRNHKPRDAASYASGETSSKSRIGHKEA